MKNNYYNRGVVYTVYVQKFLKNGSERIVARQVISTSPQKAAEIISRTWKTGTTRQVISAIHDGFGDCNL